jgi:hypothetical protein
VAAQQQQHWRIYMLGSSAMCKVCLAGGKCFVCFVCRTHQPFRTC